MARRWGFRLGVTIVVALLAAASWWASSNRAMSREIAPGILHQHIRVAGVELQTVRVRLSTADITLRWNDEAGKRIGTLAGAMSAAGERAVFATNAGIFDPSFAPLGLHIENGQVLRPLNLDEGTGNFYWKPNAVFFVRDGKAGIVRADQFDTSIPTEIATQSGPMLIKHRKPFDSVAASTSSWRTRSGVGVTTSGEVLFVVTANPCSFASFASVFAQLECSDAMYLDGQICAFRTKDEPDDGDFAAMVVVNTRP